MRQWLARNLHYYPSEIPVQAAAEFLIELLDDLALMVAQVHCEMGLVGDQRHVAGVEAADPAMAREARREAAARAGRHLAQQARARAQFGMHLCHQ